jgi:hypothetical protein
MHHGQSATPRIAVLGLHLEANAFAPPTVLEDFTRLCLVRGATMSQLARAPGDVPADVEEGEAALPALSR